MSHVEKIRPAAHPIPAFMFHTAIESAARQTQATPTSKTIGWAASFDPSSRDLVGDAQKFKELLDNYLAAKKVSFIPGVDGQDEIREAQRAMVKPFQRIVEKTSSANHLGYSEAQAREAINQMDANVDEALRKLGFDIPQHGMSK